MQGTIPIFFFFLRFYLFIHERHTQREAETQAEWEAGFTQGAQGGTQSWVSRITSWAKGSTKPLSHRGCPSLDPLKNVLIYKKFLQLNLEMGKGSTWVAQLVKRPTLDLSSGLNHSIMNSSPMLGSNAGCGAFLKGGRGGKEGELGWFIW